MGALVYDDRHRLLVVERAHDPGAGLWSIPGGRVEPGESDAEAVAREVLEETALTITVGPLIGTVERPGPPGSTYVINDYAATWRGGVLEAGDDALAARFVTRPEFLALPTTDLLVDTLTTWNALPD